MTSAALIERHAGLWTAATTHPFLDGARDGSLDEETFGRWLEQDRLFVVGLVRAWGTLLAGAPVDDFELISGGLLAFSDELAWFDQLADQRELSVNVEASADAAAYIRFLDELGRSPYPVAMTGMWAVEAAYLQAWRGILGGSGTYAAIVEHWANDDFAAFVERLEQVVDRELLSAPAHRDAAEWAFVCVCEHEARFWSLGLAA